MVSKMEPSSSTTDEDRRSADESRYLYFCVQLSLTVLDEPRNPYTAGRASLSQLSPSGYESSSAPAPRRPELLEEPLQTETAEIPDLLREPPPDLPESLLGNISPATATGVSMDHQHDWFRELYEKMYFPSESTCQLLYNLRDLYSLEPLPGDLSSAIATDEQMDYQSYCFEELHYFGSSNTLFPPPHELTSDRLESLQADISPATATDESTVYQSDRSRESDEQSDCSSTTVFQPLHKLSSDRLESLQADISSATTTDDSMGYAPDSSQKFYEEIDCSSNTILQSCYELVDLYTFLSLQADRSSATATDDSMGYAPDSSQESDERSDGSSDTVYYPSQYHCVRCETLQAQRRKSTALEVADSDQLNSPLVAGSAPKALKRRLPQWMDICQSGYVKRNRH